MNLFPFTGLPRCFNECLWISGEKYASADKLTKLTLQNLQYHDIETLLVTSQHNSAELNSKFFVFLPLGCKATHAESIEITMKFFRINHARNVLPIVPAVSGVAFWRTVSKYFSKISPVWNLVNYKRLLEKLSTRRQFMEVVFNEDLEGHSRVAVLPKAIASITPIHDHLFVLQRNKADKNQAFASLKLQRC
ncbi:uncharacterized protein BDR25DRAFT_311512 [Lindgomyces ingoldianus]|uniref:Uncharacterized protein n=1 Tax=Lindgomyces ingoldianus TaxID=673940 RepID=A0ACB6R4D9_9PLEO|nr:uncharacterized protein BDR25DRAFT_311512 [Lindgomyces ingoldianus]KAF2474119.1 hypothetical protein BDR25DRAFT_311512 [Lindgomyces ingoldianus]